jgi:hypothetical protein
MATRANKIWTLAITESTEEILVDTVRWVAVGATIGDECILKDPDGNIVFHSVATAANFVDSFHLNRTVKLVADTLDAGTVYLYEA